MKNFVTLFIAGLMIMAGHEDSLNAQAVARIPPNGTIESIENELKLISAYAIHAAEGTSHLPFCDHVNFTQLIERSGNVSLHNGWLKLPKGVYRITYAAQLQNNGGADVMQLWLVLKNPSCKKEKIVAESRVRVGIDPAAPDPVIFQAFNELLLEVRKTTYIRINYSTGGKSNLSSITATTSPSTGTSSAPFPFYLIAVKIGEL